jgi:predicted nucleotidyltransferase
MADNSAGDFARPAARIVNLDALRPALGRLFSERGARLAYLFGSQAIGQTHDESDVDVAVLPREGLTQDEQWTERLELIGALSSVFQTDHVDLVLLDGAPPLLAYEVLRTGVLLHCPDEATRIEFQVRTLREYEDTAPLRRLLAEAMRERLRNGAWGKPVVSRRQT